MSDQTENRGQILLPIARASIAATLGQPFNADESARWLQERGASFVTLKQNDQLRGCIGTIEAHRTLLADVRANAQAAALRDPRFSPLTLAELDITRIEVSVLTPKEQLTFDSEGQARGQLHPGVDGVLLEYGSYRGTFLPQVWEQLPSTDEFMRQLKRKAGLPMDFWAEGIKLYRYRVEKWSETDDPER